MPSQTVFITGATGFIAQYIIDELLKQEYKVIGSVRSIAKGDNLVKLFQNDKFSYVVIKDLIESKQDFDKVLKENPDIEIVLHTASPVTKTEGNVEETYLKPAINGTENVLNSILEFGTNVKRFVYTSSNSAVHSKNRESPKFIETEESWNDVTWDQAIADPSTYGYSASKTFAEKAVWEFVKSKTPTFETSVVNPVFVFGPQLFKESIENQLNFSNDFIYSFFRDGENYKKFQGSFIDVRDVAKAHLLAFQNENTINKRLILKESTFTEQTLLDLIHKEFPILNDKIPKGEPGSDEEILKKRVILDNSKTKEILGFKFKSLKQTIHDTVEQIIEVKGY